jgi:hypothetical protein
MSSEYLIRYQVCFLHVDCSLTCFTKCLGITCDNASNNDTMIQSLEEMVESFRGHRTHARCFNHVVALIAKKMIRLFDVNKTDVDVALDEAEQALWDLAEGIDAEELQTQSELDADDDDDVDNEEGLEGLNLIPGPTRDELERSTQPVKLVLVKVSDFFFSEQ